MPGEFVGVMIVVLVGTWLAVQVLEWRRAPHGAKGASPPEPATPPAGSPEATRKLHRVAIFALVGSVSAVVFYLWAGLFRELGSVSLTTIVLFALPLVLGFIHQGSRRAAGATDW